MNLFIILLLTFSTYALISCGGAEERKAVYLEKAIASIEAGDNDKARITRPLNKYQRYFDYHC